MHNPRLVMRISTEVSGFRKSDSDLTTTFLKHGFKRLHEFKLQD